MPLAAHRTVEDEQGLHWEPLLDPPGLQLCGNVVVVRPESEGQRIYVNGYPILGSAECVLPGDFICLLDPAGGEAAYRFAGITGLHEEVSGRRCALSGEAITGPAVVCACGKTYSEDAAVELKACPACEAPLNAQATETLPAEELL